MSPEDVDTFLDLFLLVLQQVIILDMIIHKLFISSCCNLFRSHQRRRKHQPKALNLSPIQKSPEAAQAPAKSVKSAPIQKSPEAAQAPAKSVKSALNQKSPEAAQAPAKSFKSEPKCYTRQTFSIILRI